MKWYPRDPSAWLAGVIGLNAEQRGFYDTVIDLLYARDGKGVTDTLVCQAIGCRPHTWKRVKAELIHSGKISEAPDGSLMANRVESTLSTSRSRMVQTRGLRVQQLKKQELRLAPTYGKPKPYNILSFNGGKGVADE
jgi:uncharacterized protein DUF1376